MSIIYTLSGYLDKKKISVCNESDIEINNNKQFPAIKVGYTDNNYNQRKEEAMTNMIIEKEIVFNGTQKMERLIHKTLKSSKITSQLTLPIEKKTYDKYYTEYYHNYNNIIYIALRFTMNQLNKHFLKLNDKRLPAYISFKLDEYLEKDHKLLISDEYPLFRK